MTDKIKVENDRRRDVFFEPRRADYPSMIYWQYADNARIEGIDGPVDLNVRITPK